MSEHSCYQCGLPVPIQAEVLTQHTANEFHGADPPAAEARYFCCAGCLAVSQLISDVGLEKFYQYRDQFQSPETQQAAALKDTVDFSVYDEASLRETFVKTLPNGHLQANLYIEGIHCAACTWLIEEYLGKQDGVARVNVNSASHRCLLEWDGDQLLSKLMHDFTSIGYQPKPALNGEQLQQSQDENRNALLRLAVAGFAMVQVGMFAVALYAGALQDMTAEWQSLFRWVSALVATPVVFFSAREFFRGAFFALRAKTLTMDVPVALAIGLAYIASCWATLTNTGEVYFDSVSMFTFLLLLGRYLEMRVRHSNVAAINQLHHLLPPYAYRISHLNNTDDATAKKHAVLLHQLNVGDYLWIGEGDTIPADGNVVRGECVVNESMLTGEAQSISKFPGASVSAGTLNTTGSIIVEVTAAGNATRLSAIQTLMTEALHQKPQQVSRADYVAAYFVGAVLLVAIAVAWTWYHIDPSRALWVTLSVLVVTCPCAFSLATPVSLTAALHRLRHLGLLVTKAHVVEALATIDHVLVDKTGTLTTGNTQLANTELMATNFTQHSASRHDASRRDVSRQTVSLHHVLGIASALEQGSNHPLSKAFCDNKFSTAAEQLNYVRGQGVEGTINGVVYRLGKWSFANELVVATVATKTTTTAAATAIKLDEIKAYAKPAEISSSQRDGVQSSEVWLSHREGIVAKFIVHDKVRTEALPFISTLLARNLAVELLSGDQPTPVARVASQLGIAAYTAELSPEEKLNRVKTLQAAGKRVLMVGDGLNDLPVLSGADVSIAMSSATDLAQVQADSVLLNDDLSVIPKALGCAIFCQKIVKQNITWAVAYNIAALPLAAAGFVPPYVAAIGMSLSSLMVMLNATRIFKFEKSSPVSYLPTKSRQIGEASLHM